MFARLRFYLDERGIILVSFPTQSLGKVLVMVLLVRALALTVENLRIGEKWR